MARSAQRGDDSTPGSICVKGLLSVMWRVLLPQWELGCRLSSITKGTPLFVSDHHPQLSVIPLLGSVLKASSQSAIQNSSIAASRTWTSRHAEERLRLLERIRNSLYPDDVELTGAQREELDPRLDELERDGACRHPREDVLRKIRDRAG